MSNFDAYFITRLHKSPRPFAFAIKSTDNLSFFENTADYLHVFSCGEKEGKVWMEKILVARVSMSHSHILIGPSNVSATSRTSCIKSETSSLVRKQIMPAPQAARFPALEQERDRHPDPSNLLLLSPLLIRQPHRNPMASLNLDHFCTTRLELFCSATLFPSIPLHTPPVMTLPSRLVIIDFPFLLLYMYNAKSP